MSANVKHSRQGFLYIYILKPKQEKKNVQLGFSAVGNLTHHPVNQQILTIGSRSDVKIRLKFFLYIYQM